MNTEQKFTSYTYAGVKVDVRYSVEGDVDGCHYTIDSLTDMFGNPVEYNDNDDLECEAAEHYQQMVHDVYMKTGQLI